MIKILFVSENSEEIARISTVFSKNQYEFSVLYTEMQVLDYLQIGVPDIIILDSSLNCIKSLTKHIKSFSDSNTLILYITNKPEQEILKSANAYMTKDMPDNIITSTINVFLKTKSSLEKLSNSNKDLADSLYRLNALYSTSSNFAETLDKEKLLSYMIEGLDKALSFSLTCTLSFCTENEPVLILNSLYEISDEILSALKLRTILNYKNAFENPPYEIEEENLKVIKTVKYPGNRFTFSLFQYDNMFAPITLGENVFGCVEIFKDSSFSSEDATCFQTIARQVALPLKNATLYQEIKETNHKLEKLERLKSEFISIVSHELRTPLTSIKNSLDILLSGKCGEVTDNMEKFLNMASRNVQRLSGIINDLLDLSKIEAGKMDFVFKNMNIHSVVDYVKSALSEVAKEHGLTLNSKETDNLPDIYADSQRLEQVLTNLVSNAIKFTPEGKNITIKTELINASEIKCHPYFEEDIKKLNGEYIMVSVADEGIGIAEKDLLHAFDKFAQLENSLSRKVGGSGLGLPIAKQLLEAHQGTIWCDSTPDVGSTFHFVVPVAKVPAIS